MIPHQIQSGISRKELINLNSKTKNRNLYNFFSNLLEIGS